MEILKYSNFQQKVQSSRLYQKSIVRKDLEYVKRISICLSTLCNEMHFKHYSEEFSVETSHTNISVEGQKARSF